MKKVLLTVAAAIIYVTVIAQDMTSPLIVCQGRSSTVDIRDLNVSPTVQANPLKAPIRPASSKPEGFRWVDRIYNLPEYLYTFYERYGDLVNDVLTGNSNCLSDPTLATDYGSGIYATDITTIKNSFTVNFSPDATAEQLASIIAKAVRDTANIYYDQVYWFPIQNA